MKHYVKMDPDKRNMLYVFHYINNDELLKAFLDP